MVAMMLNVYHAPTDNPIYKKCKKAWTPSFLRFEKAYLDGTGADISESLISLVIAHLDPLIGADQ